MAGTRDKVTRFDAELVDAATVEGARQSRSARQQLDHWVRLGRAVSTSASQTRVRVEAALAGDLPLSELRHEEGLVVDAEVAVAVEERLAATHFGRTLAAEGVTTVALDADGRLIEYRPDGSSAPITSPR